MGRAGESGDAPLTSFGTSGTAADVARSGELWTPRKSLLVLVIGLAGMVLAAAYGGGLGLVIPSALIAVLGLTWMAAGWRSRRDADHLMRRAAAQAEAEHQRGD